MSDFTQDDLFEAVERAARTALARGGATGPPIDALELAQSGFDIPVEYAEPEDEGERRYGAPPKRRPPAGTIVLRPDQSDESQHAVAARAVAARLVPEVVTKLGIAPGTENKQWRSQLIGLLAARLLLPTQWFPADARRAGFDLLELKEQYPTAGFDMLALRLLDATDDPCVIAIVDDGVVAVRRANTFAATRKLTAAEQQACDRAGETEEPAKVRADGWTAWAWPTAGIPFRRIVVRAVPDEI